MKRLTALTIIAIMAITTPTYAGTPKKVTIIKNRKIDEYRKYNKKGTKVTDTDNLHIYSNTYKNPDKGYSKFSNDEFSIGGKEPPANDRYKSGSFDEIHIPEPYQDNVWQPEEPVQRMNGFDEFHLPNEM